VIRFDHWWLPDREHHLQHWMRTVNRVVDGRMTYQYAKYESGLAHCARRRVAVDIGAHVGLWSFWMARDFEHVHAFEPHRDHQAIWLANMTARPNATLHGFALGSRSGHVDLIDGEQSTGDTRVDPQPRASSDVPLRTLDSFGLEQVDLIKIDCEGFEEFIVDGARQTIAKSLPALIVEQKPGHAQRYGLKESGAVDLLESLGYFCRTQIAGDYVMTNREAA
jgi:FkbM family methyltransferase